MLSKYLIHIFGVVLTCNGEQYAASLQLRQDFLKIHERAAGIRRSQLNPVKPHFTKNSAPKSIIKVSDETFPCSSGKRSEEFHILGGQIRQGFHSDGRRSNVVEPLVVPLKRAVFCDESRVVKN